jgi:hypothetical protein
MGRRNVSGSGPTSAEPISAIGEGEDGELANPILNGDANVIEGQEMHIDADQQVPIAA